MKNRLVFVGDWDLSMCVLVGGGGAKVTTGGNSFGAIELFCILITLGDSWIYTWIQLHRTTHTHTHTQLNAYKNRWKLNKVSSLVWQPGSVLNQCQLPSMDMVLQLHKMLLLGYGFNVLVFLLNYESIIISK